jgi:hypothetical protein
MVSGTVLGALAGFLTAMVTLGLPLATWLYRIDRQTTRALRLLTGADEVEGDGVIPRLRRIERKAAEHRQALRDANSVEIPEAEPDGGDTEQ